MYVCICVCAHEFMLGMWKSFAIFSPTAGLKQDEPSITLKDSLTADLQDIYFQDGEVKRFLKKLKLLLDANENF